MEVLVAMELTPTDAREEGLIYRFIDQCSFGHKADSAFPGYMAPFYTGETFKSFTSRSWGQRRLSG